MTYATVRRGTICRLLSLIPERSLNTGYAVRRALTNVMSDNDRLCQRCLLLRTGAAYRLRLNKLSPPLIRYAL